MAGEEVWLATVAVHRTALKHVLGDGLFSNQIQACHCPPTNSNNNNTLIYIAPACRMTSEALADSSSRAADRRHEERP